MNMSVDVCWLMGAIHLLTFISNHSGQGLIWNKESSIFLILKMLSPWGWKFSFFKVLSNEKKLVNKVSEGTKKLYW